jgi:putative ATPase
MILWGPPGTGKTTLASLLAHDIGAAFERISAVDSGVREIREIIARADFRLRSGTKTILFIDEVHRFNKSQQDALLHAVERGVVTIIGATTENPSFEVNSALLSRCQVYKLYSLSEEAIRKIVEYAIATDTWLAEQLVLITDWKAIYTLASGDARSALNALEAAAIIAQPDDSGYRRITPEILQAAVQRRIARYDRAGDAHYDTISAFIKTIRGSDPDAAMVYLVAMLEAGEDPLFIARRLIIIASEDVGNADPQALNVAVSTFLAIERIGLPEGRLTLSQCTIYLACAPKSNASYLAFEKTAAAVRENQGITIPLHLRNAPTNLMKEQGYGFEYKYPHDYPLHFIHDNYFPNEIHSQKFYDPDGDGEEAVIRSRLKDRWPERWNDDI